MTVSHTEDTSPFARKSIEFGTRRRDTRFQVESGHYAVSQMNLSVEANSHSVLASTSRLREGDETVVQGDVFFFEENDLYSGETKHVRILFGRTFNDSSIVIDGEEVRAKAAHAHFEIAPNEGTRIELAIANRDAKSEDERVNVVHGKLLTTRALTDPAPSFATNA